jgi:hypothetical protein
MNRMPLAGPPVVGLSLVLAAASLLAILAPAVAGPALLAATPVPASAASAARAVTPAQAAGAPSLTIYTRDLGFVRETRTLELAGARDTVRLSDLPERLDFPSVRLVPGGGARVTRLAYRWDVAGGDAFLDNSRGRRVSVTSRGDRVTEGTLVASDGSWLVVRADDGSLTTLARSAVEAVRLAAPAANLSLRPTLEAVLADARRGRTEAELSYLTGGLSWSAEHTVVRTGDREAVWSATVMVENTTGRDYLDATLKLVAGDPRRELPRPGPVTMRAMAMDAEKMMAASAPDLSEETFSEYHLYTLGRPATLRGREQQSFTMIEPRPVKVTPRYVYRGGDARGVMSQMEILDTKEAGLGVPLPGGRVRFYEADPAGAPQFTGETSIKHTPEGEKLTLEVGSAFDLAAERRDLSNKRITDREREYSVEVKLRNRKKTDVTILVREGVGGDTEITQKTHEFVRKDANTLEFAIPVPAGQEVVLRYTARVRY